MHIALADLCIAVRDKIDHIVPIRSIDQTVTMKTVTIKSVLIKQ